MGSGVTRNNCIHWTCDKENHTVYLTNTKCVDRNNQTWEDANHAFIATALLKLLDLYPFSFIYWRIYSSTYKSTHLDITQSRGGLDLMGSNSKSVGVNMVWGRGKLNRGQKRRIAHRASSSFFQKVAFQWLSIEKIFAIKNFYSPHKPSPPPPLLLPKFFSNLTFFNWSVGHQLATFFKILVAKYNFHLPLQPKWSQLGALLHVSIEGLG